MKAFDLNPIVAMGAGPQPGQQADPKAQMFQLFAMMAIFGVMFYFLLIRPQRKQASALAELLKNLKAGDRIVTSSGIVGVVVSVKDTTVAIRSADAKMEVLKSAVSQILERAGETAETKS
jgi:preprotein translocase subunit YajC